MTPQATATVAGLTYQTWPASVVIEVPEDGPMRWSAILHGGLFGDFVPGCPVRLRLTTPLGVFDGDASPSHQEYIGTVPGAPFRTVLTGCGPLTYVGPAPS